MGNSCYSREMNNDSISPPNSRPKLPFPGNGKGNYKMPREGKFEACIPGNHRKREFPLTPGPVWLTDNSSSRADCTVWEYSFCKRYFMFLCISIPFYLFCIFIPTSRHPVWNYWRNLPHHSALSVFCLFTICFKNFSKVFLFNFQIKNICKSIISAQFKAADVVRPIDMIAWIACPWFSSPKKTTLWKFLVHPPIQRGWYLSLR